MKTQIVFWLIGAIDGHAKNFSIFLGPGGRFHLTPLYDVMSAQPAVDTGQIRHNKMKLALAVGKNNHYVVDTVMPRHFLQTGEAAGMPGGVIEGLMAELLAQGPAALEQVQQDLPKSFLKRIFTSVRDGFLRRADLMRDQSA